MEIIALIPTTGKRPYLKAMLEWLASSGEVDSFIMLEQSKPTGKPIETAKQ